MSREDFRGHITGKPPGAPWEVSPDSPWRVEHLLRPKVNRRTWPAVDSPHMHVAFPGLARDPSGRLYLVYREGYTHATYTSGRDGRIMLATSDDGGHTWSRPRVIQDDPDCDDRNAAVEVMPDGSLVVCWDQYLRRWHRGAWYKVSRDGGKTWSEPVRLGNTPNLTCRSRPVALKDGSWLFPVYCHFGGKEIVGTYVVLVDPGTGRQEQIPVTREAGDEISICEVEPGRILGLIRDNERPWLWQAWSEDGGKTWSQREPSELPSQFTPCDVIKLTDGRIACVFSFRERRNERLAISEDGGRTWNIEETLDVFDATVGFRDRSYPAAVALDGSTVGVVLYETHPYPQGGRIWFAEVDLGEADGPRPPCLHNPDPEAVAEARLPLSSEASGLSVRYRFTGRFGPRPNGIEVKLEGGDGYISFWYWMGISPEGDWEGTDRWQVERRLGGGTEVRSGKAVGDSFDDGNEHTLALEWGEGFRAFLDEHLQVSLPWRLRPEKMRLIAHRASLAVYTVEVW